MSVAPLSWSDAPMCRKQDLTQRTMIATWLVELYLAKINHLEDLAAAERLSEDGGNLLVERSIVEEDLRHFLSSYKVCSLTLS